MLAHRPCAGRAGSEALALQTQWPEQVCAQRGAEGKMLYDPVFVPFTAVKRGPDLASD